MAAELHLFVLWEKARFAERRIMDDLRAQADIEIVDVRELAFRGDPAASYKAFYGPKKPLDAARKTRKCGGGPFLLIVVRNLNPAYGSRWARDEKYYIANELMYDLKERYREWAGRKHRVHGTTSVDESARDLFLLTGHTAEEWARGVPDGVRLNIPAKAGWRTVVDDRGAELGLADCRVLQEDRYINDVLFEGRFKGRDAVVKCSSTCAWSVGNEFRLASRLHAAAPSAVPEPLAVWTSDDGRRAFVVTEKVSGPSLTELLVQGVTDAQADGFAADILMLAKALKDTCVIHRDLFADNLLLGPDGHLKAIDWQLAIDRNDYREDPWVAAHPKFLYVVFGVNRDLGLGVWNDFRALVKILGLLPQTEAVRAAASRLADEAPQMTFEARPDGLARLRLRLYAVSLRLQMALRGRKHRKYAQLERRYRTIVGSVAEWEGPNG